MVLRYLLSSMIIPWLVLFQLAPAVSGPPRAERRGANLISGYQVLLGTVEEVTGDGVRIETGEAEPRFVPREVLPALAKGDRVEMTLNDHNDLVNVHKLGEDAHYHVVQGRLAESRGIDLESVVIRRPDGHEETHGVRPVARSKVASIPVGVDAVFLIDERNRVVDLAFGSSDALRRAMIVWMRALYMPRWRP